jgi:hypothetical protein
MLVAAGRRLIALATASALGGTVALTIAGRAVEPWGFGVLVLLALMAGVSSLWSP